MKSLSDLNYGYQTMIAEDNPEINEGRLFCEECIVAHCSEEGNEEVLLWIYSAE